MALVAKKETKKPIVKHFYNEGKGGKMAYQNQ